MVLARALSNNSWRQYPGEFVNLHVHSDMGSLMDALKIDYNRVKQLDKGIGLSEHGTLFSLLAFYYSMKKIGKTPIFGLEAYVENFLTYKNKKQYEHKKRYYHLVLFAKNIQGVYAMYDMVSKSEDRKKSEKDKPIIRYEDLLPYKEHFVCLTACLGGELPQYLIHNQLAEAREYILSMKELFGEDFYIEIQRHNIPQENIVNPGLISLSRELGVGLVATPDAHYSSPEDEKAHKALYCIRYKKKLNEPNAPGLPGSDHHLYTPQEAEEKFPDLPDALDNTIEIYNKCKGVEIEFPKSIQDYHFPTFQTPQGYTEAGYFKALCIEGFNKRFANNLNKLNSQTHINRLNWEINTILQLNFPGYFLLVQDIVNFCKRNGIWTGPGRGSVGGSLVAYCLGITEKLDPMDHDLLFERFLNIARQTAPDIDLDFDSERRDEVFDYLRQKYGEANTAQIVTFGTLGAKAAIRDATRVLDHPYSLGQSISKLIPSKQGTKLIDAFNSSETLRSMYQNDARVKSIIDLALRLEGIIRNLSTHAAGFVVTDKPTNCYIPTARVLSTDKSKLIKVTQFTMLDVEKLGLLKIDILGLGTITQLRECIDLVNITRRNKGLPPISINSIPLNDIAVYKELLGSGNTFGVFQLSSDDAKALMKKLFANTVGTGEQFFEDTIAGLSLNRPGPMKSIPAYLANRANPANIRYDHESLIPILSPTHGILVYQEQVSLIAQALAGYSPEQADILRRAISKKDDGLLEAQRIPFIQGQTDQYGNVLLAGCLRNGVPLNVANKIFEDIVDFSKYAFNKSHAASYGVLSIQGAWLKHYYPTEFMASLLNRATLGNDNKKLPATLVECEKMGIKILPPDINFSNELFSIESPGVIRYGLAAIKGLGYSTTKEIVKNRLSEGDFMSVQNLSNRLSSIGVMKKDLLESLIYSGALDLFPKSRQAKINSVETTIEESKKGFNYMTTLFDDLIANPQNDIPECDEFSKLHKLHKEREYLGAFLTDNPLDDYLELINKAELDFIKDMTLEQDEYENPGLEDDTLLRYPDGTTVKILGYVLKSDVKQGKKKTFMSFEIADTTGTIKGTAGIEYQGELTEGSIVYITAPIEHSENYGTQLKFGKVSKVLSGVEEINTNMFTLKRDSMVVAYVNNYNMIENFSLLQNMSKIDANVSLYFSCLETGRKFAYNGRISLKDQKTLDILKENSKYLTIR